MIRYWWGDDVLAYGDGRIPEIGVTHTVDVDASDEDCAPGLHGCASPVASLQYRDHGDSLWVVDLGGTIVHRGDKSRAGERTYLARVDSLAADEICRVFSRWCALSVAHLWEVPHAVAKFLLTGEDAEAAEAAEAVCAEVRATDRFNDARAEPED